LPFHLSTAGMSFAPPMSPLLASLGPPVLCSCRSRSHRPRTLLPRCRCDPMRRSTACVTTVPRPWMATDQRTYECTPAKAKRPSLFSYRTKTKPRQPRHGLPVRDHHPNASATSRSRHGKASAAFPKNTSRALAQAHTHVQLHAQPPALDPFATSDPTPADDWVPLVSAGPHR
jgi:hypothetical protein